MRSVHWFRSDLRLRDNRALDDAAGADELVPLFVWDERLVANAGAPRLRFLVACLERLDAELRERDLRLVVRRGDPAHEVPKLCREVGAERLCFNRDYSPYARARDERVRRAAEKAGVRVRTHKDRVVFESDELRTQQGGAYRVYTPFRNAWWSRFTSEPEEPVTRTVLPAPVSGVDAGKLPSVRDAGDEAAELPTAGEDAARRRLASFLERAVGDYATGRDRSDRDGTSRLSPYLRFGVLSTRLAIDEALAAASAEPRLREGVRKWVDELIWRDFYHAILAENPHVLEGAFRPEYDRVRWNDDEAGFEAWCAGRTGYPFVDAGMRQLRATGWMHNRARMAVASFLVKDLLVDWRRGEAWFMQRLVDGDPASNNGGWQWSASTGTDAQPYFRVFNPTSQGEKCDPDGDYVRRWVPELEAFEGKRVHQPWKAPLEAKDYPPRIVDHAERRKEAIARFKKAAR